MKGTTNSDNSRNNETKFIKLQDPVASITSINDSYTPVNDCWMTGTIKSTNSTMSVFIKINNVQVISVANGERIVMLPVKAGQSVTVRSESWCSYNLLFHEME